MNNSFTNPFKRPSSNFISQRPQTPINNINNPLTSYSRQNMKMNRSFSKLPGFQNRNTQQYYPNPRVQNMSRSRISVQSSTSQLAFLNNQQVDIFPQDLLFLLKNQQKNINNFKDKIQKQKNKVENDFAVFKTQIQHILQDVKISVQAQLDLVYKTFITKYAQLKGEVQQMRQLRKQILMNNVSTNKHFNSLNTSSNRDLIGEIQKDAEQLRNYKVYGYLSQLQKQKLQPILGLSNQLILIGSADCPFYRNKDMNGKLKQIRTHFSETVTEIYNNLHDYITTPQAIIEKQKQEEENTNMVLKQMNQFNILSQQQQGFKQQNVFNPHYPNNYSNVSIMNKKQAEFGMNRQGSPNKININMGNMNNNINMNMNNNNNSTRLQYVSSNQQCSIIKYGDQVSFNHKERILTDHQQSILCIFFIDNRHIATGSKDRTINIYTLQGSKVATLRGHNSSICCLSLIKGLNHNEKYLASGSDHGCSSLILWDVKTWTIVSKVVAHSAAVTAIVDLQDGRHLVTGSYDKKINLYNHNKGKIITSLNNNRTSVTSMIMTYDKSRLISAGLDNSLSIWTIVRKNQIVQSIIPQISIPNDSLICQLQPSILKPQHIFAATRNGHIKVFNVKTGECTKTLIVNSNSIIQLATIQRQMKPEGALVFSCSSKDNSLVMTKMDTGMSSVLKLKYNTGIEFGCGIGPKIVWSQLKNGLVAILNQGNINRQFNIYELDIK